MRPNRRFPIGRVWRRAVRDAEGQLATFWGVVVMTLAAALLAAFSLLSGYGDWQRIVNGVGSGTVPRRSGHASRGAHGAAGL